MNINNLANDIEDTRKLRKLYSTAILKLIRVYLR